MPYKIHILLHCLTSCTLIGLSLAVIGKNVRYAPDKEFSYVVSIAKKDISKHNSQHHHVCTGSLISKKSVLTAAHCLIRKKISDIQILAGSTNLKYSENYLPESWITFDEWAFGLKDHIYLDDIAVITLKGEGVMNSKIIPTEISMLDSENLDHQRVVIAGWGVSESGRKPYALRKAPLTVISSEQCNAMGKELKGKEFAVPLNYFCTEADAQTTCGDGGAPILNRRRQLVGINVGTCPDLEGPLCITAFLNQHQLNNHLRLHPYEQFITHAMK